MKNLHYLSLKNAVRFVHNPLSHSLFYVLLGALGKKVYFQKGKREGENYDKIIKFSQRDKVRRISVVSPSFQNMYFTPSLTITFTPQSTQSGNGRFFSYIPSWWKNQPWLVRVGMHVHPLLLYLSSWTKLQCTLQLRGQMSTIICTLWFTLCNIGHKHVHKVNAVLFRLVVILFSVNLYLF